MIDRFSPHKNSRRGDIISMVVIHGDAGRSDQGTLSWLQDSRSRVSYHYLVGRDGEVYRIVPEHHRAWHAGRSAWKGETDAGGRSVNGLSVGVAFANRGPGEPFKPVQYKMGAELVADIMTRRRIPIQRVVGHFEVSPGRKTDPWDHFNWAQFGVLILDRLWRDKIPKPIDPTRLV